VDTLIYQHHLKRFKNENISVKKQRKKGILTMGGIHLSPADLDIIKMGATCIGVLGVGIGIMWRYQNDKLAKFEAHLSDQAKRCEEENVKLKETMIDLLKTLADVKEELGFLKGLVKRNEDKAQARIHAVKK
jgi:hypothetical protein